MKALVRVELFEPNFMSQHLFESVHEITRCPLQHEKFVCQGHYLEDARIVDCVTDTACGKMHPYKVKDCRGMQPVIVEKHKFDSIDVVIELEDHTTTTTQEYEEKLEWYRRVWLELI